MTCLASKPHMIHIGFPKTGSTFLQHWFEQHPEIAYQPGAFAGMYTVYDLVEALLDDKDRYRCRVTSAEQLVAPRDASQYGSSDPAEHQIDQRVVEATAEQLKSMFPDASILIVTRGFRDILKSGFSQLVRQGAPFTSRDFPTELSEAPDASMNFNYDEVIALYERFFPGRVLVLPYEMLARDRRNFLGIIENRLGLSACDPGSVRHNESLSEEQLFWYPRLAGVLEKFPHKNVRLMLRRGHAAMIARGLWKPLLLMLRLINGRVESNLEIPCDVLRAMSVHAQHLVEREEFEEYREFYMFG